MLIAIALAVVAISLIYWFLISNYDHWKKRGVYSPPPKIFTGNYPSTYTQKQNMIDDLDDIYCAHKRDEDFVGIFSGRDPQLLILSPTLCRRVFVNDFKHFHDNEISIMIDKKSDVLFAKNPFMQTGEAWKAQRALLAPGLTLSRIKTVYPVTNKICQKMTDYIKKQLEMAPKDGINGNDLCLRFTCEVVTDCVLGLNSESLSDKPTPIFDMIKKIFDMSISLMIYFMLSSIFPAIKTVFKARFFSKDVEEFFIELMDKAIELRKQNDREDFLHYMLELKEKKNLTTLDLTANTMTFLLDGYETTATAIAHCLLLLARYPETQDRLRAEIMANIDENGNIDFDRLADLCYLDACLHEAIRIFAPFHSVKICTEPITFTSKSGRSVDIQKNDLVVLPLQSIMLDEDHYPNAQEFRPERFLEEYGGSSVKAYRERGLYYGFGDGPRVCMGMRFALTQAKAALVEILQNFNVRLNPKTRNDNQLDPKHFLARLDGDIWLDFEIRK